MRVDGWRIDGFGGLADWQVEALAAHDLIVVCGPNESGKSTLRSFIATAYYGFSPAQRETHPYAPLEGRFGGALQLVDADGERLSVERELRSAPRGRVYRATTHEDLANRPLPAVAGIGRAVYLDLHSLGIDELMRVDAGTWRSVEDRLLAGSALAFLRSAGEVRRALDEEAATLWRPDRRGQPESRKLRERIAALRAAEREAAASRRRLDEVDTALAIEREREDALRRTAAELAARRRRHAELAPALAAWRDVERLRGEAAAILPRDDDFPGDPADAVDRRRAEAADAERAAAVARRHADELRAAVAVPETTRALAARAGELRELAAEESGAADLRAAIGVAEASARTRREEADRRAEAVLGRPLERGDREALAGVRAADLRAAVAHAAATPRRSPSLVALAAAVLCGLLAVIAPGGRTILALAAVALLGMAARLARAAAPRRTGPTMADAVGALAVAPSRLARPDAALPGDVDALRAAVAEADAAQREAARLRELATGRSERLQAVLAELGLASAGHALASVDEALVRVAEARKADDRLAQAVADEERLAGAALTAAQRRDALLVKLQAVRPGEGLDAAVTAVLSARRLRAAADERLRGATASFGDPAAIAAEAEALERQGTPLVLDDAALAALDTAQDANASALEELQHRRGALVAERQALAALPGVADAAGEAAVYEEELHRVEQRRDRLAMASSVLLHAERRFRERHGPGFLHAAGTYLQAITGGRYERLLISQQAGETPRLEVVRDGEPIPVGAPLSRGTLEQIYISLRLALVDEVDPGRLLPLYLDEALVNWDDERIDGLVPLLTALGGRQVLLATCHPELAGRLGTAGAAVIEMPGPRQPSRVSA